MKRTGLTGFPVAHSLSPALHNAVYRELGLDWEYGLYPCVDETAFAALVSQLDQHGAGFVAASPISSTAEPDAASPINNTADSPLIGLNVTTPYKPQAFAACEQLSPAAEASAAVNVLTAGAALTASTAHGYGETVLTGDNTDGRGLLVALKRETGITPADTHFVICGTGAVARSIVAALGDLGAVSVTVLTRQHASANTGQLLLPLPSTPPSLPMPSSSLPPVLSPESRSCSTLSSGIGAIPIVTDYSHATEVLATADVLIDATTLGMHLGDPTVIPAELLRSDLVVIDTVYGHGQTALLRAAQAIGAQAFDGLGMLVEQAALTIEIWLTAQGISAEVPRELMYAKAREASIKT